MLGFTAGRVTGGAYRSLVPEGGEGIGVLLRLAREGKRRKNRLHLDLRTTDVETEVRRVLGLGAALITDQAVMQDGWRWHVGDSDGNEFCVLQPPGEGQPTA